ncbi:lon protease mitochondrial, partial [Lasius niger]
MIPRSRVSGRLILDRSTARASRAVSSPLPRTWALKAAYRSHPACALRFPSHPGPAAFSTSAGTSKERDEGKKGGDFFDSAVEPPTEPLSEEEAKANLENKKRETVDKAVAESKTNSADSLASAKTEGGGQAQDGKAGGSPAGAGSGLGDGSGGDGGRRGRKSAERAL